MDGNPYPEEAITFHGSTWTSPNEARINVYKERNWAIHATTKGNAQSALVHAFGAGLDFVFDSALLGSSMPLLPDQQLASISITSLPEGGWAHHAADAIFGDVLGLKMYLTTTNDPDVLQRTGTSPYTLRRIISPEGKPTAHFALWQADVNDHTRPDTGAHRPLGPMPDLWLTKKVSVPSW